jgi:hypothetical protein
MRRAAVTIAAGLACGPAGPLETPLATTPAEATPSEDATVQEFEAVVRVDERPGGKKFQGVWLERDGGERWVVAYRPEGWLRAFEGRRVRVTGEVYQPFGQAIAATHFRVATLRIVGQEPDAHLVSAGPARALVGEFAERVGAPGTKLEGERYTVFVAGGTEYLLAGAPEDARPGARVKIEARAVEPSPYAAHRGGEHLWVLTVAPAE